MVKFSHSPTLPLPPDPTLPFFLAPSPQPLVPTTMTQSEDLRSLLESVATGNVSPDVALDKLKHFTYEQVGEFARIDHHRALRTGFPEVIWGLGKTPDQIAQIIEVMRDRSPVVMATRIEPAVFAQLKEKVPDLQYYPMARICALEGEGQRSRGAEGQRSRGAEGQRSRGAKGQREKTQSKITPLCSSRETRPRKWLQNLKSKIL